jgi:hypothetical protein
MRVTKVAQPKSFTDMVVEPTAPPHESIVPPKQEKEVPTPWGVVIDDVVRIDVSATFARLSEEITLGDGATEYGAVLQALDRADANYVEAVKLSRAAKLEQERIDRKVAEDIETMRTAVRGELEREKKSGERSKAPTLQDIEDRMIANWPTEYSRLRRRSEEIHAARAVAEGLEMAWRSRASSLRSMADRYSPTR